MRSLILLLSLGVASTAATMPFVIYGKDSRRDYFEIEDLTMRQMADATVVLAPWSTLQPVADGYRGQARDLKSAFTLSIYVRAKSSFINPRSAIAVAH
jgi:hypothetical protein